MATFSNLIVNKLPVAKKKFVGFGSVVVGDVLELHFSVIMGTNGVFASLPSHKGVDENGADKWYQDARLVSKELYNEFQGMVKMAYEGTSQAVSGEENQDPPVVVKTATGDSLPW